MDEPRPSTEWNAGAYHRLSAPQFGWGMKVLERVPGTRGVILDVGCGTGRLTAELSRRCAAARVLGLDLSHSMLVQAKASSNHQQNVVAFWQASGIALPVCSGIANGVFSTATFHWIEDHDLLFREIFRVLRPRGWLHAQYGGQGNLDEVLAIVRSVAARAEFEAYFSGWRDTAFFYGVQEERRRLTGAGFHDAECWLESAPVVFNNADEFVEFGRNVVFRHHIERIPDPERQNDFLLAVAASSAVSEYPFTFDYVRLNVSARK